MPLQTELVRGMESMLAPRQIRYSEKVAAYPMEPLRENVVEGVNPFTQLLDEESHLTPEVACAG